MQSVSGFSPAPQAVNVNRNAMASFPNKNHNLFAGGHTDSFQSSQASVKFAALYPKGKKNAKPLKDAAKDRAVLSADKPNSNLVANPRDGKMYRASGWQLGALKKIRNNASLSNPQKIKQINSIFARTFAALKSERQPSTTKP